MSYDNSKSVNTRAKAQVLKGSLAAIRLTSFQDAPGNITYKYNIS